MNKIKNYVLGSILLAGLFLAGSLMQSRQSQAKGGYSSPVSVMNTASAPAIGSSIDDPGRIPYQAVASATPSSAVSNVTIPFAVVPANRRLVITEVFGQVIQNAVNSAAIEVNQSTAFGPVLFLPAQGGNQMLFSAPVLYYFDAGETPQVTLQGNSGLQVGSAQIAGLAGYMLDCSAAPCSPIAH